MRYPISIILCLLLVACGSAPDKREVSADQSSEVVMYAMSLADTPYNYGGNSAGGGFDCSGFVGHVYRHTLGISLPRTAREISRSGRPLKFAELQPGDLVFYNTLNAPYSHVGIYIGDGKFVHSPKTGGRVRTEQMHYDYWRTRYEGARRIVAQ